ncbi:uncharacterized protein ACBT44_001460 isoform 6-T6 [Syngnathus typhle]
MFPRRVTPLPTVLPTLLPLVTLAALSLSAPLALPGHSNSLYNGNKDKSAALLAPLDGKATRQAVTSLPAAAESGDTSTSPDGDDSQGQAQAQPNNEDLYRMDHEGASDAPDSESSSEAGKDSEKKTSSDSEPGDTIDDGGNGLDPMAAFDLEDGDAMEEEEIREEDETSSKDDKGSDANLGTADAELGVDDIKAGHNDQHPKESSQIFDSTEATLVEKSDVTPSHLRE